jgi:hypothetical protein
MGAILDVLTPRRLVTTAVLLLAAVVIVIGFQRTNTTPTVPCGSPTGPIVKLIPCPGQSVPNQTLVGAQMSAGLQVDLTVDGTAVPKDQVTAEGPNFYYQPNPDLRPGNHTAAVTYYGDTQDASNGTTFAWSFSTR